MYQDGEAGFDLRIWLRSIRSSGAVVPVEKTPNCHLPPYDPREAEP